MYMAERKPARMDRLQDSDLKHNKILHEFSVIMNWWSYIMNWWEEDNIKVDLVQVYVRRKTLGVHARHGG